MATSVKQRPTGRGEVVDAVLELSALAAVAAGAARVHVAHGARLEHPAACVDLTTSEQAPRIVRALGQITDGGPLHPTLLFAPDEVPASVRALIERLPAPGALTPFARIDEAHQRLAAPVAERLVGELRQAGTAELRELR